MAIWTRARDGVERPDRAGPPHRRRQPVHLVRVHRAARRGRRRRLGRSVGDAYDNALAESQIGLYKTELIRPDGPGATVDHVEIATLDWVDWFNNERTPRIDRRPDTNAGRRNSLRCRNRLTETG